MALESRQQGGSFLSITCHAWPHAALAAAHERLGGELALPVAVALAAAAHGIALEAALGGYLHAFTANLISAAVRTVPLGQSDGQLALAALEGAVRHTAEAALAVGDLDDVGTATPLLDWCSLRHETQYTRLFRS
jgi:urease accessory protein